MLPKEGTGPVQPGELQRQGVVTGISVAKQSSGGPWAVLPIQGYLRSLQPHSQLVPSTHPLHICQQQALGRTRLETVTAPSSVVCSLSHHSLLISWILLWQGMCVLDLGKKPRDRGGSRGSQVTSHQASLRGPQLKPILDQGKEGSLLSSPPSTAVHSLVCTTLRSRAGALGAQTLPLPSRSPQVSL